MAESRLNLAWLKSELGIEKRGHDLIATFCGWDRLTKFENDAPPVVRDLGAGLFSTGARITEALRVSPSNFRYVEKDGREFYEGTLPCLKKGADAAPLKRIRIVPMPLDEPTTKTFSRFVDKRRENYGDAPLYPYSRVWYWSLIQRFDPEWWPHRFRTERASQLVTEYGYGVVELVKFFNWNSTAVALGYARLDTTDLALKMRPRA